MNDLETRTCKVCGKDKLLKSFPKIGKSLYRERRCYSCRRINNNKLGRCGVCYKPAAEGKTYCEEHLKTQRQTAKKLNIRHRIDVLYHYCNGDIKCQCCHETCIEFLTIDHINGGGNEHRRELGTARKDSSNPSWGGMYKWLKKNNYPEGFRVLCFNCNCARGIYGYCPHEKIIREICEVKNGEIVLKGGAKEVFIVRQKI